jgi:hypothetical protein
VRARTWVGLLGVAMGVSMGTGVAAYAADYPPTTTRQTIQGSVPTTTSTSVSTTVAAPTTGLPFTGGTDSALVWIGVGAVGTGTFAASRLRRARPS